MEYGLIGEKLGHSYSKEIHEILADYRYELHELPPDALGAFLKARSFRALNVTIPYKERVLPYLDAVSERASASGAVNTIVNRGGKLYGFNTDVCGLKMLIRRAGIDFSGKKVMILGSGGTSKTAQLVSREMGAREIIIISRRKKAGAFSYEEALKVHRDTEILLNTTPVGMAPDDEGLPIDLTKFPMLSGVIDVIYHPIRTNLVLEAKRLGIAAAGGLYMLAAQAAESSALFTGMIPEEGAGDPKTRAKITEMTESAFQKVLLKKSSLVLIGMPSSGKSLAGQHISEMTGRMFVNTDDLVEERLGEPIPGFIRREGEDAFRAYEQEAVREVSSLSGYVIATGGGAVLRPENVRRLKRNGRLIFLKRSLEALKPMEDRPLSDTLDKLAKMYEVRRPVYEDAADETAEGCEDPEETARAVLRAFLRGET
jgi:shikimate dehydrogenase